MNSAASLVALALALVPLAPLQDTGKKRDDTGSDHYWPWGNAKEADRIRAQFCGVWQLVRVDMDGQSFAGAQVYGYLIAVPNYCSIQATLSERSTVDPKQQVSGFDAGSYKWQYDESRLTIAMNVLIHGSDIESRQIEYEPQGARRDYLVTLSPDDMTLDRGGNNRLYFRRVQKALAPEIKKPDDDKQPGEERKPTRQ